jgi:hypothetical protein
MAESAIETVFSLFACAIFILTCVSITGSIVAAVLAGKRDGTTSRGQQAVAIDRNTKPEDSTEASRKVLQADRVSGFSKEKLPFRY